MNDTINMNARDNSSGLKGKHIAWIVFGTVLLTATVTYLLVRTYIYAQDFEPVVLNSHEQQQLDQKLLALGYKPDSMQSGSKYNKENDFDANGRLIPEKYSEEGGQRDLSFSEKELNSLLSNNTDMAKKLAIDLSHDLVSARILVPVDKDFPILGGKTLRVSTGIEMSYKNNRPSVILKGLTVMGVPIPNSWLGGLKNIDLISEFGDEQGFWKGFSEGVDNIHVEDGKLKIKLKE